ncbi:bacterio-opsin activator domain-containing protein [Halococcus sp. PRR34]|uniref:bacterio-opsin activator domain-containing protein n=1 Tax=Halococcus sp. PRR34 TaxID=3020830 RepID=UPI00235F548D|nr:bacterio-opsin activator domain-containing protein [Halococcus sp. PRR34]
MPTITEFTIPAHEFALSETLERRPDLTIHIDRVVAHNTTEVVPFVRITNGDIEDLSEVLEADPSVTEVELFGETDDERFYRLVWEDTAQVIGYMINEQGAAVQEATAANGEWHLQVLFPEREGLSATNEFTQENDLTLDIARIYDGERLDEFEHDLTERQYDTLAAAVQQGYYEVPREVDLNTLADDLDISHQALSERFRRATKSLVTSALTIDEEENEVGQHKV